MRLFTKLFCIMLTLTTLACSFGGYLLIDRQFRNVIQGQAEELYQENLFLRFTLLRELQILSPLRTESISQILDRSVLNGSNRIYSYCICDESDRILSGDPRPFSSENLSASLGDDLWGWKLAHNEGTHYMLVASPLEVDGATLYLENWTTVEPAFDSRAEQYRLFVQLMLGLILLVGLIAATVSAWVTRPLRLLSEAVRKLAQGDFSRRLEVRHTDEIGALSADFNSMADQLERQISELALSAKRQEDFLHSFAHETKTPLTSIIGYAELLSRPNPSAEMIHESASYIHREGRRLESLSKKLMELIVLEKTDFSLGRVEMSDFLHTVCQSLRPLIGERIELRVRAEPGDAWLEPDLMETVLANLLNNARKAIDGSGVISVVGTCGEDSYTVQVSDTGKGIPPEEISRITEPFYMVDKSRARLQGGAGLGLMLCQRIIHLHGGSLSFASTVGTGTCVTVVLKGGRSDCRD